MRFSRWAWMLALMLATGVLIAAGTAMLRHPHDEAPTLIGQRAPDTIIGTLDGQSIRVSALEGQPVVVNFWASWCASCRSELEVLNRAANENATTRFLGVDIQDSVPAASAFEAQHPHAYPVGPATTGGYLRFGVTAPPETFFLDSRGVVAGHVLGPLDPARLSAELARARR